MFMFMVFKMSIKSIIKGIFGYFKFVKELEQEIKDLNVQIEEGLLINDMLQDEIIKLTEEYNEIMKLLPLETDYSMIPDDWKEIPIEQLVTDKYTYYGVKIEQALTDLLDSSYISRKVADSLIKSYKFTKDTDIKYILLKVYNHFIRDISYITNNEQYGEIDQWDNGDLAIKTRKGDCDVTSRVFIRVMKDILYKLKHDFDTKYFFLCVGYLTQRGKKFGHAWVQVPVDGKWYLFELTKDGTVSSLKTANNDKYDLYFCHNNRKGWYKNINWKVFI